LLALLSNPFAVHARHHCQVIDAVVLTETSDHSGVFQSRIADPAENENTQILHTKR
jgi:hypothetical protein